MTRHRRRLDSVDRTFLYLLAGWLTAFAFYLRWGVTLL